MTTLHLTQVTLDSDWPELSDTPLVKRYQTYAQEAGIELVLESSDRVHRGKTLAHGKREVFITRSRGAAVKPCTGIEPEYRCCNLHVINQTTNCPLDCSYCILQAYINSPVMTVQANLDEIVTRVREQTATQPRRLFRIGTGDLGDSLALDALGGVSRTLVPSFADMPNVLFELKTKTDRVDELIGLEHGGRTVVSWSLNTPPVIEREEHRCAPLDARLSAARRAVDAGYLVSFHFDPMVVHDGWQARYPAVVERIFEILPSERIAWISMGALRFPPSMLKTIEQRFPKSLLPVGELIHASDGKMRYIKPIRLALFRTLYAATRDAGGREVFTYLCMEGPEIWRRVIGWAPESRHQVDYVFARSLARRFPYLISTPRWADYDGAPSLGEIEPGRGETVQNSTGTEAPGSEASTPRRGPA